MPRSMTGFARKEQQQPWGAISCEIRSVNHRYLEYSFRLPDNLRHIEPLLRNTLKKHLGRGKVEVFISYKIDTQQNSSLDLNENMAKSIIKMAERVNSMMFESGPISSLDILNWPGVMQSKQVDQEQLESALKSLFKDCLKQLIASREREGEELEGFIEQHLKNITAQVQTLRRHLPELQQQQHDKLRSRLNSLDIEIDNERLSQELVYLAQKSDVVEELDRLEAHITEITKTLKQKEPIGRRLDFLMQELNREANTLSSKSTSSDTTQTAVDLKVYIEQMREQIQNIE